MPNCFAKLFHRERREVGCWILRPSLNEGTDTNRRVLGSMNDLAFQARHHLTRGDDLPTIAERLAHTPMSAIGEGSGHLGFPDMLARAQLAGGFV